MSQLQAIRTTGPDQGEATAVRRRRFGALGVGALALLLISCATGDAPQSDRYDSERAHRMFAAGYLDVASIYIEDVGTRQLAMAGLRQLGELAPEVEVVDTGDAVGLTVAGSPAANYPPPAADDIDGWARLTAAAIASGQERSTTLRGSDSEVLYETVFDGFLTELDEYSRYAGRAEARENRASRSGFGGIGVRIRMVENGVHIVSVMENTPAARAGLRDNDVIVTIEGEPTADLDQRGVIERLRGRIDTSVEIEVEREGVDGALPIRIVRAHIVPQTVFYRSEGNTAVLQVEGFNQDTTRTLRGKIKQARKELGSSLNGFVLDLRNNPGGLLDQSVSVVDLFLSGGRIVSTHGRHPDSHQFFDAHDATVTESLPLVVLVNGNSASAAEIVAAALQDSNRAVVIGSSSFGKGTVQTVLRLPNDGELTLTWARFHAPSGYALQRRGVLPDICTSGEEMSTGALDDQLLSGRLPVALERQRAHIDPNDLAAIEDFRAQCPAALIDNELDLGLALHLVENPSLYALARGILPDTARRSRQDQLSLLQPR
jgi:carboxyl-terminal processing protease